MASRSVYEGILKDSKKSKVCAACTRPLNNQEFKNFEKHVRDILNVQSPSVLQLWRFTKSSIKIQMRITTNWLRSYRNGKKNWTVSRNFDQCCRTMTHLKWKKFLLCKNKLRNRNLFTLTSVLRLKRSVHFARPSFYSISDSFLDSWKAGSYQWSDQGHSYPQTTSQ